MEVQRVVLHPGWAKKPENGRVCRGAPAMLEGSPGKLAVPYVSHIPHQAIHSLPPTVSHQDSMVTLEATWSVQHATQKPAMLGGL